MQGPIYIGIDVALLRSKKDSNSLFLAKWCVDFPVPFLKNLSCAWMQIYFSTFIKTLGLLLETIHNLWSERSHSELAGHGKNWFISLTSSYKIIPRKLNLWFASMNSSYCKRNNTNSLTKIRVFCFKYNYFFVRRMPPQQSCCRDIFQLYTLIFNKNNDVDLSKNWSKNTFLKEIK